MDILYKEDEDLLYIRLDDRMQVLTNRTLKDGVVLEIGEDNRIVAISIQRASKNVKLSGLYV